MKKKEGFEKYVNVISLTLGVIALLLSWQANIFARKANEIAVRQIDAQVVVFDVSRDLSQRFSRAGSGDTETVFCNLNLRVVNLGGAVIAITGFRAAIKYGDTEIELASDGNKIASDKKAQISDFKDFSASLGQSIPIQIDSLSDLEIPSEIIFSHSMDTSYYFYPEYVESATPLEVRYFISLSNGVEISSPKGVCYYIESNTPK
jgi:hypothetical protein